MQALKTNPEADLKLKYHTYLEAGLVISLVIMILFFYSFKKFETSVVLPSDPDITIETIEIPQTIQFQRPPAPAKPSIPVETEDEDILDDVTIEEQTVDFTPLEELPPPPEADVEEIFEFFAVSEKPEIMHKETPKFPDLAKRAGIEGTVVVTVTIGKDGKVENANVFRSIPMLDEAAVEAARKCTFKPAKQRDKFVKVKMNIPFQFKLK
jgi:protein TonB